MKRKIIVRDLGRKQIEENETEMVERKGIGHPDSLADGVAEAVSCALSREYIERFGTILHHNTDKALLACGKSSPAFKGGEMIEPIKVILAGRAVDEVDGELFPAKEIAIKAAKKYLKKILPMLNPEIDIEVECEIGQGSASLKKVISEKGIANANDTSFGCGFAPLSELENAVLEVERYLNSENRPFRELGPDIKVMGLRMDKKMDFTLAGAFIGRFVDDIDHYFSLKDDVIEKVEDVVEKLVSYPFKIHFNTLDNIEKENFFLTVLGTSLEMGDEGQVGRGNRVNGLITPHRPMSLEASAGKNPIAHVGKIYNLLADISAKRIFEELGGEEVHVKLLSQIGKRIDDPLLAEVAMAKINSKAEAIMDEELENIERIKDLVLEEKVTLF